MSENANFINKGPVTTVIRETEQAVKVLAVGEPEDWKRQGNVLPSGGLVFVGFSDITQETLGHFDPEVICSPVLAYSFDCIDLALLLHSLNFQGQYTAFGADLPKPAMIEREVRQLCPQLNFRIAQETD